MKKISFIFALTIIHLSCSSQNENKNIEKTVLSSTKQDSIIDKNKLPYSISLILEKPIVTNIKGKEDCTNTADFYEVNQKLVFFNSFIQILNVYDLKKNSFQNVDKINLFMKKSSEASPNSGFSPFAKLLHNDNYAIAFLKKISFFDKNQEFIKDISFTTNIQYVSLYKKGVLAWGYNEVTYIDSEGKIISTFNYPKKDQFNCDEQVFADDFGVFGFDSVYFFCNDSIIQNLYIEFPKNTKYQSIVESNQLTASSSKYWIWYNYKNKSILFVDKKENKVSLDIDIQKYVTKDVFTYDEDDTGGVRMLGTKDDTVYILVHYFIGKMQIVKIFAISVDK
jgi:hypothetical protein